MTQFCVVSVIHLFVGGDRLVWSTASEQQPPCAEGAACYHQACLGQLVTRL